MYRDGERYDGVITGGGWIESSKGTPGFRVDLENLDGEAISKVWYITDKTRKYFERDMEALGVKKENLLDGSYLEYQLAQELTNAEVNFGIREEEYKGTKSMKVSWVGPRRAVAHDERGIGYAVARIFGGSAKGNDVPQDDDIPF